MGVVVQHLDMSHSADSAAECLPNLCHGNVLAEALGMSAILHQGVYENRAEELAWPANHCPELQPRLTGTTTSTNSWFLDE